MTPAIHIIASIIGILMAKRFVPDFIFEGDLITLIIAGGLLGALNFFVKPFLKLVSFPLILLSFGLFSIIINMLLLWLTDIFIPELTIETVYALLASTLLLGITNFILGAIFHSKQR